MYTGVTMLKAKDGKKKNAKKKPEEKKIHTKEQC